MFLRYTTRKKNGKEHRYYSLVENRRVASKPNRVILGGLLNHYYAERVAA